MRALGLMIEDWRTGPIEYKERRTTDAPGVLWMTFIIPVKLCDSALVSRLFCSSSRKWLSI